MTLGFVLFLGVLGLWQRRVAEEQHRRVVEEIQDANERGTRRAIAQHPQIDAVACIGCGSCVKACPEDGVLGLVHEVAHVIHGSRCIGHGRCAVACPVEALTVGLGDVSQRTDIPVLSEQLESSVPGLYIAGELGGFALIRNAIEQGKRAVDSIAQRVRPGPPQEGIADVLIVGAGPAGIAASLKAIECKLSYMTIAEEDLGGTVRKYPRRKLTMTQPVDLPLYGRMKKSQYLKEELVDLWDGIVRDFGVVVRERTRLTGLERDDGVFVAQTSHGELRARFVVLALGRRGTPRRLGVAGEDAEKVLYQLVDTSTYTDEHLLVVGGGDSAIEAATGLADQSGNVVTLSYRKPNFFRLKARNEERIMRYAAEGRVRCMFSSGVEDIRDDSVELRLDDVTTVVLPNDYVFVFAGGEPPYPLLKSMGIRFGGEEANHAEASSKQLVGGQS